MRSKMPRLDFPLHDRPSVVKQLLARLAAVMHEQNAVDWQIDLSRCTYLGPDAIAVLAATVLEARNRRQSPVLVLPSAPKELVAFCHFSGLAQLLDDSLPLPDSNHPRNETVPILFFREAKVNAHWPLLALIKKHAAYTEEFDFELGTCFSEIIQNVQDHSQSSFGGVASARYFASRHEVRVAVVDRGRGIHATLMKRFPGIRSPVEALKRVIKGNYSALSRPNNLGLGISNLAGILQRAGGRLLIVSDRGLAELSENGFWNYEHFHASFPGTAVFFSLPVT